MNTTTCTCKDCRNHGDHYHSARTRALWWLGDRWLLARSVSRADYIVPRNYLRLPRPARLALPSPVSISLSHKVSIEV